MTTSSKLRRVAVAILAAATAMAGLIPLTAGSASAVSGFTFTRLSGTDRFDTARRIAVATFGTANTALLARADLFPDALSGSYLAGSTDGGSPVLLTEVNRIPSATNEALSALGTKRVILLGGPAAISPAVEAELRSRNLQVERIGGRDRFETSQQIAERLGAANVGSVDGQRTAVVASGRNFPDALAGGPLSYARRLPSILTDTNSLPAPASSALSNLGIKKVFLLGGPSAVSGNVQSQIESQGIAVERLGGANRQATAALIATTAYDRLGFDDTHINLARGDFFTDALTGGPHGGDERNGGSSPGAAPAPIVLSVSPTILGAETAELLRKESSTLRTGHIFGGPAAISTAVEGEAARAAGSGRAAIVLNETTVQPGGTITGRVTGESISRMSVSGCGLNDQEVVRTGNGDFSITIPAGQPGGECSLTFRVTFTDGSVESDVFSITIASRAVAATGGPELTSVEFVRRVTQPNPLGSPFTQTVMRFIFDEAVTGQALRSADTVSNSCSSSDDGCSAKFKLYRFDQTVNSANPNRVYEGRNAQMDSANSRAVLVTFGQAPANVGTPLDLGEREYREITVAGVDERAVRDSSNIANPFSDAPVNSVTFAAGTTVAPDLVSLGNFRPNFDGTRTLVDFSFDEPAVREEFSGTTAPGGYFLIFNDADVSERECDFVPGPTNSTTNGNGTSVHTVSCPNLGLAQSTASSVARGLVKTGTVRSTDGTTIDANGQPDRKKGNPAESNPLQTADVSVEGATTRPDLVSVQFFTGRVDGTNASFEFDQALFTFDESVNLPPTGGSNLCSATGATCFAVYSPDAKEIGPATSAPSGSPPPPAPVRASSNDRQVVVTFPDGSLLDATGAFVGDGAVQEAVATGGVNRGNRRDEVAVQGASFAAGLTTGPDFIACRKEITARDPISGAPSQFRLVFEFDKSVQSTPDGSKFAVYDVNGNRVAPRDVNGNASTSSPSRRPPPNADEVILSGYANQNDLSSIVSCGVAGGAVLETDGDPNPIGYEIAVTQ